MQDDSLSRIQREIKEVTEREREFREGHFRVNRQLSESALQVNKQNGHAPPDFPPDKTLNRAVSISNILYTTQSTPQAYNNNNNNNNNVNYNRRFKSNTKGIMQRFIANKGKLPVTTLPSPMSPSPTYMPPFPHPVFTPLPVLDAFSPPLITRTSIGKPVRKGFVPVEEKIQKELREMKDREHELKRMRKKQKPFEIDLSDAETSSESEDEELPPAGKLKPTKSLGELYEALSEELRSPSRNSSGQESLGSLKPAKSLAELCELAPGQQFLAPSSTRLIAQWESIIQQKEAGTV